MTVVTRFAPSPTGLLHIGGIRTALYAWAFARKNNGHFVLRIEDTDTARSTKESADAILSGMAWLGLDSDSGPFYQTDRLDLYRDVINMLMASGHAFKCYDTRSSLDVDEKHGREVFRSPWRDSGETQAEKDTPYMIRFRAPDSGVVVFEDLVKGTIVFDASQLEDFALMRSNGTPMYNLAAVVDDVDMGITHVIRGDDHVNNTPKQILIYQAMGATLPAFAHLPMIQGDDGKKLSKRHQSGQEGKVFPSDIGAMQALGVTPAALLNYMARLGWAHGDDEIFDLKTFVQWFDFRGVQQAPARVNLEKLHWVNGQHLKNSQVVDFLSWSLTQPNVQNTPAFCDRLGSVLDTIKSRCNDTLSFRQDIASFSAFCEHPPVAKEGALDALDPLVQAAWRHFSDGLGALCWDATGIDAHLRDSANLAGCKFGPFASSLRKALSDLSATPPLAMIFLAMGRDYTVAWLAASMASGSSPTYPPAGLGC
jgi:glutamyl-tRNA synthetase